MLSVNAIHMSFGGNRVLNGISLEVPDNKIVALIGANGAGKSTTLRIITGLLRPDKGQILLDGQDITRLRISERVKLGVVMMPEGARVFTNLTVLENLKMGAYVRDDVAAIQKDLKRVFDLFPTLKERALQKSSTLSGGERQILAIGRALMSTPKVILMDTPAMGLAPSLVSQLFDTILQIRTAGMAILLVEQNVRAALRVTDYGYVLEGGRIVLEGPRDDLARNDQVRKTYIGF